MDITYKSKKLKKICTDAKAAERIYGKEMAEKIQMRIDQISAADTVEMRSGSISEGAIHYRRIEKDDLSLTVFRGQDGRQYYGEEPQFYRNAAGSDDQGTAG